MPRKLRFPFEGHYILTNDYRDHLRYSNAPGTDWALPAGTPVYAAAAGTVTWCEWGQAGGRYVIVDHGGRFLTLYSHLSWVNMVRGEDVQAGHLLGLSGSTGRSVAPHLHFAVKEGGKWIDPEPLLQNSHVPAQPVAKPSQVDKYSWDE